jgi:hypothetical protein
MLERHTPKLMTFLNELCGRPASEKSYLFLVCGYLADEPTVSVPAKVKKPFLEIAEFRWVSGHLGPCERGRLYGPIVELSLRLSPASEYFECQCRRI